MVWVSWCSNTTNTGTASATTYYDPWQTMVSNTTTATTTTVWTNWVVVDGTGQVAQYATAALQAQQAQIQAAQAQLYQQPQPTQAELEAIQARRNADRAKALEAEKQRNVAAARAMELLRANLSQKQREALDKNGWFLVEGGKSKKTYRVHGDRCAGNIFELNKAGKEAMRYCVHASYEIPLGDQLLAQALSLRLDEEHLVGRANKTALAA